MEAVAVVAADVVWVTIVVAVVVPDKDRVSVSARRRLERLLLLQLHAVEF